MFLVYRVIQLLSGRIKGDASPRFKHLKFSFLLKDNNT